MIILTALIMMIVFILGLLFFSSTKVLCVFGLLAAIGVIMLGVPLPFTKSLAKNTLKIATAGVLTILFVTSLMTGMVSAKGGTNAFDKEAAKIRNLVEKEKTEKAREELTAFVVEYGSSNLTVMLDTLINIGNGSFDNAFSSLNGYTDKTSMEYYTLLESVYLAKGDPAQASSLGSLYLEASRRYPLWTHMQKMAGITRLDTREFAKGEYLLLRAYEQDSSDFETAYYLGVACFEQKRFDDALVFFDESVNLGANETIQGYISWYALEIMK